MSNPIFYMVRHGRTQGNEKNIYRGWSNEDFAQLDENGKQDARDAGIYLKGLGVEAPVIIADDLGRIQETAKIIADVLGAKEIITDKRLRPVDVGNFTGKSKTAHPLDEYMDHPEKKIPGGESLNVFNKRQAKVFADITEAVTSVSKQLKRPVTFIVIGHGSNTSFLYHHVNKGGKEVGYEGMTEPGGILTFTKEGIQPIFKKRDKKDPEKSKLDQAVVLYMTAAEIGKKKGAHCDDCWKYRGSETETGKCAEVEGDIEPKGVCGLYVYGERNQFVQIGTIPKEVAGYIDDGPTKCGLCEYFGGTNRCEKVKSTPQTIEEGGCCNAFEAKKSEKQEPKKEE